MTETALLLGRGVGPQSHLLLLQPGVGRGKEWSAAHVPGQRGHVAKESARIDHTERRRRPDAR
jgi:hypothetical protein